MKFVRGMTAGGSPCYTSKKIQIAILPAASKHSKEYENIALCRKTKHIITGAPLFVVMTQKPIPRCYDYAVSNGNETEWLEWALAELLTKMVADSYQEAKISERLDEAINDRKIKIAY